jgi:hypothetical protein
MRTVPDCALDDEIVTMRPHPAASMSGTAAWRQWNVPCEIHGEHAVPRFDGDVAEGIERVDARARDHDRDRPELAADLLERRVDRRAVADVHGRAHRICALSSQILRDPLRALAVEVEQRNAVSRDRRDGG